MRRAVGVAGSRRLPSCIRMWRRLSVRITGGKTRPQLPESGLPTPHIRGNIVESKCADKINGHPCLVCRPMLLRQRSELPREQPKVAFVPQSSQYRTSTRWKRWKDAPSLCVSSFTRDSTIRSHRTLRSERTHRSGISAVLLSFGTRREFRSSVRRS